MANAQFVEKPRLRTLLGGFHLVLAVLLGYLLLALWPPGAEVSVPAEGTPTPVVSNAQTPAGTATPAPTGSETQTPTGGDAGAVVEKVSDKASVFGIDFTLDPEIRFLLIVILASGVGSFAFMASSFAYHVSKRQLDGGYLWWYILRPLIGAALALIFYFLTRGGLLSASTEVEELNPFGIAGVAALIGMFSRPATKKLKEVFDTLFALKDEDPEDDDRNQRNGQQPSPPLEGQPDTDE